MSCLSEGAESLELLFPTAFSKWLIAEPDPKVPKVPNPPGVNARASFSSPELAVETVYEKQN